MVIDKPVGLVVHPGAGNPSGTVCNGLAQLYPEMLEVGEPHRPGIVHRLDRATSGLMVAARSDRAYRSLVDQLASHEVERALHRGGARRSGCRTGVSTLRSADPSGTHCA
ncbi:MAG: pseudouridine synthase [Microthrixaceae bacterium]